MTRKHTETERREVAVDVPMRWALGEPTRRGGGGGAGGVGRGRGGASRKPSLRVEEMTGRVGGGRRSVPRSPSARWFKDGGVGGGGGVGGAEPREEEGEGESVSRREVARRLL